MKTVISKIVFILFLISPVVNFAQTRKLSGTVVSFNKFPVKDVTVEAKKAKTETLTDENGKFEIEVKKKDVLLIREKAFVKCRKRISDSDNSLKINLIIKNDKKNMEYAVEEGHISREDMDYGVKNLWNYNNIYSQFNDTYEAIKHALPEVTIIVENGRRGVQFRGPKTITGSNAALILVNGVITEDASFVTPSDIISIYKLSPSEAALFGSRAGNRIINIETQ